MLQDVGAIEVCAEKKIDQIWKTNKAGLRLLRGLGTKMQIWPRY